MKQFHAKIAHFRTVRLLMFDLAYIFQILSTFNYMFFFYFKLKQTLNKGFI